MSCFSWAQSRMLSSEEGLGQRDAHSFTFSFKYFPSLHHVLWPVLAKDIMQGHTPDGCPALTKLTASNGDT